MNHPRLNAYDKDQSTYFKSDGNGTHMLKLTLQNEKPVIGIRIYYLPSDHPDKDLNDQISNIRVVTKDINGNDIFSFKFEVDKPGLYIEKNDHFIEAYRLSGHCLNRMLCLLKSPKTIPLMCR